MWRTPTDIILLHWTDTTILELVIVLLITIPLGGTVHTQPASTRS